MNSRRVARRAKGMDARSLTMGRAVRKYQAFKDYFFWNKIEQPKVGPQGGRHGCPESHDGSRGQEISSFQGNTSQKARSGPVFAPAKHAFPPSMAVRNTARPARGAVRRFGRPLYEDKWLNVSRKRLNRNLWDSYALSRGFLWGRAVRKNYDAF